MNKQIGFTWTVLILFFVFSLVFPASFQTGRGMFLILYIGGSFFTKKFAEIKYNRSVFLLFSLNIIASFFFILTGILKGAPGVFKVSTVYFIWPILFFYFVGFLKETKVIPYFINAIILSGILSCLIIINFILNTFGLFSITNNTVYEALGFSVFWEGGFTKISSTNLVTVFYVFILTFSILLFPKQIREKYYPRFNFILFAFLFCGILLFLSGRRAFWLVGIISPAVILMIYYLSNVKVNLKKYLIYLSLAVFIVIFLFIYLAFDNERFTQEFASIFVFDDPGAESNLMRKEQYESLMKGWANSPLWGGGLGSVAPGSIRDPLAPWNYELSYIAILFQTGIIGMFLYTSSIFWIVIRGIQLSRKSVANRAILLPFVSSLVCFLFANATNPYLAKFDYLWIVFFPVGVINAISLSELSNDKK